MRAASSGIDDTDKKLEGLISRQDTPLKLGYTMPGEFEPHAGEKATLLLLEGACSKSGASHQASRFASESSISHRD